MKALFVTSETSDVDSLVRAWGCFNDAPSERATFPHMGAPNDDEILAAARVFNPDIIFYIGSAGGPGNPSPITFQRLREIAPSVNLCCDAGDQPWWSYLEEYRRLRCFDLQVTLDGHRGAPVDHVTVTPVDPRPWDAATPERVTRCGFSGGTSFKISASTRMTRANLRVRFNKGLRHPRDATVSRLEDDGFLTVRRRHRDSTYSDHVDFMKSCRLILNTSASGSDATHQVKGRVLESGWAGCALLESAGSPIADWFPPGSYFKYKDIDEAKHLMDTLTDAQIHESAAQLHDYVREHYHPSHIFGGILDAMRGKDANRDLCFMGR